MALKVYEWKEKYYGSGHSGLFIETDAFEKSFNGFAGLATRQLTLSFTNGADDAVRWPIP